MSKMFNGCRKLSSLDLSSFITKNVTDMSKMFSYCTALKTIDLSNFHIKSSVVVDEMFKSCGVTQIETPKYNYNTSLTLIFQCYFLRTLSA